jgi:hypothetical protein
MTVIDRFNPRRVEHGSSPPLENVATDETALGDAAQRVEVTYVQMWSVIRVAVVFWTLAGATCFGALLVVWALLRSSGQIEHFQHFVESATGVQHFHLMSTAVLAAVGMLVLVLVFIAITLTVVAAVFYNSFATFVGGVEVRFRYQTLTKAQR